MFNMKNKEEVKELFNSWSIQGLDKQMEKGHQYAVRVMLEEFKKMSYKFDFLDVGCGNGWTLREVSKSRLCRSAWGIDVSDEMIRRAKILRNSEKQHFLHVNLLEWKTRMRFDVILSMEALYYIIPVELAVKVIYNLLKEGGVFLCGVDYYLENKASHSWPKKYNVRMDLLSKKEWVKIFVRTGFRNARQKNILYPAGLGSEKWKQKLGTLLTQGQK